MHGRIPSHALARFSGSPGLWDDSNGVYLCGVGPLGIGPPSIVHAAERMRAASTVVVDRKKADAVCLISRRDPT